MNSNKPVLLVTGVSGRIGKSVALKFANDYQVVGLDIAESEALKDKIDFLFTDISSAENVKDSLAKVREKYGEKIASVIHLAAYYTFSGGQWEKYEQITIQGTQNLLDALADFTLDQFVFSSTMLVYNPAPLGAKLDEDSVVNAKWEYPLSKVKTENLILERKSPARSVMLRIAGIYDDGCHSIPLSQQIVRIYEKQLESHFFPGNPQHGATFLHMDDLVRAIQLIVEKRNTLSHDELFILGEPEHLSYRELQDEMGMLIHGKKWPTLRIPKWMAKVGAYLQGLIPGKKGFIQPWMIDLADDHYPVDVAKAKKILGWEPIHVLKNTLPVMVEGFKRDPEAWYREHGFGKLKQ